MACSAPPTTSIDCKVSPGATCIQYSDTVSYCLESCTFGNPLDLNTKCHGRADEACQVFTSSDGTQSADLCTPMCATDTDCGSGLHCDTGTGSCTSIKPAGDAAGSSCDPDADTPTCLGSCLITTPAGTTPPEGVCVDLCSVGSECGFVGAKPSGFCTGPLSDPSGTLDLGFCEPACNCTSDCKITGDVCLAWTSDLASTKSDLGSDGICFGNPNAGTELTCADGGAGGAGGAAGAPSTTSGAAGAAGAAGASDQAGAGGAPTTN